MKKAAECIFKLHKVNAAKGRSDCVKNVAETISEAGKLAKNIF